MSASSHMPSRSVGLPGGLRLRSTNVPPDIVFPGWHRSWLRARLLLWRTAALFVFTAVVMGSVYGVGTLIRVSYTSVHVPGVVTAQNEFHNRSDHCVVDVDFALNGQGQHGTVDTNTKCVGIPGPGSSVTLNAYPDSPNDFLTIVGHDAGSWSQPWPMSVAAALGIIVAGLYLRWSVVTYRRVRSLAVGDVPWQQVTTIVRKRETTRYGTRLRLEATDMAGQPRIFCLAPGLDLAPWPNTPGAWDEVTFCLKTNGRQEALFYKPGDSRLRLVFLSTVKDIHAIE